MLDFKKVLLIILTCFLYINVLFDLMGWLKTSNPCPYIWFSIFFVFYCFFNLLAKRLDTKEDYLIDFFFDFSFESLSLVLVFFKLSKLTNAIIGIVLIACITSTLLVISHSIGKSIFTSFSRGIIYIIVLYSISCFILQIFMPIELIASFGFYGIFFLICLVCLSEIDERFGFTSNRSTEFLSLFMGFLAVILLIRTILSLIHLLLTI